MQLLLRGHRRVGQVHPARRPASRHDRSPDPCTGKNMRAASECVRVLLGRRRRRPTEMEKSLTSVPRVPWLRCRSTSLAASLRAESRAATRGVHLSPLSQSLRSTAEISSSRSSHASIFRRWRPRSRAIYSMRYERPRAVQKIAQGLVGHLPSSRLSTSDEPRNSSEEQLEGLANTNGSEVV